MSATSPSQGVASVNEESNNLPMKRKRGRPRKSESLGFERPNKPRPLPVNPTASSTDGFIGQPVSGYLDGAFDCGYFLTVQVGGQSGPVLKGLVFEPSRSVPVTPVNDIAPHLPMHKRVENCPELIGSLSHLTTVPIHSAPSSARPVQSPQGTENAISLTKSHADHTPEDNASKTQNVAALGAPKEMPKDPNDINPNIANPLNSELTPKPLQLSMPIDPNQSGMNTAATLSSDPTPKALKSSVTISVVDVGPISGAVIQPCQTAKDAQVISDVPSAAIQEIHSVTIQASEAQVAVGAEVPEPVEAAHVVEVVAVDEPTLDTSGKASPGKGTAAGVLDPLTPGTLTTDGLSVDQLEEISKQSDEHMSVVPDALISVNLNNGL